MGCRWLLSFLHIFLYLEILTFRGREGEEQRGEGEGGSGRWQDKALFPPHSLPNATLNIRNRSKEEDSETARPSLCCRVSSSSDGDETASPAHTWGGCDDQTGGRVRRCSQNGGVLYKSWVV